MYAMSLVQRSLVQRVNLVVDILCLVSEVPGVVI